MSRFQKHIFVCVNERPADHPKGCCLHKGAGEIRAVLQSELKKKGLARSVRANASGCLDACEFGVTMVIYPEGVWYGGVTMNDVPEIISEHVEKGNVVSRLLIKDPRYQASEKNQPESL
jgi:(2Fe-2S) ferredoxin